MIDLNNKLQYKNITLISNTNIVIKIFSLVCNKLNLNLNIINDDSNLESTDVLIYEHNDYNKNNIIKYKSFSKVLVVIANEMIFEYESCHLIKKPFLPSQLINDLNNIITYDKQIIKNKNTIDDMIDNASYKSDTSVDSVDDLVDFIDSIDEDEIEVDDESNLIINKDELGHGGVLDKVELDALHNIINETDTNNNINGNDIQNKSNEFNAYDTDKSDWLELSDIIDKAIVDVDNKANDDVKIILSNSYIQELPLLFEKLNQDAIDILSSGEELTLSIKIEGKNV